MMRSISYADLKSRLASVCKSVVEQGDIIEIPIMDSSIYILDQDHYKMFEACLRMVLKHPEWLDDEIKEHTTHTEYKEPPEQ